MVYEVVNLNSGKAMATTNDEARAHMMKVSFKAEWPRERYGVQVVDSKRSTRRDGPAVDCNCRRPDAAAVGDGAELTIGEYHGTKAVFYGRHWLLTIPSHIFSKIDHYIATGTR